jgi:ferredoxin
MQGISGVQDRVLINLFGCDPLLNIDRYRCGYCGACVGVCPECALELIETWLEVSDKCIDCGRCVKICPVGALELKEAKA